jgi:hypothetical protein
MSNKICRGILCLCIFWAVSCGSGAEQLSPEEKYTVDTLYNSQLTQWRRQLDSICALTKDTLFAKMADSIRNERMAEIEALLMLNQDTK